LVLGWLLVVCRMPVLTYLAGFVYPGVALTLLRSFIEHRPAETPAHRSAIVEASPIFSLLYLNNNLHSLHHRAPAVPWYELPPLYRSQRAELLAESGGYAFAGYAEIARRYAFTCKDSPIHTSYPAQTRRPTPRRPRDSSASRAA
jgi:fatty acid desaturase